jgi:hypothetical protein
MSDLFRRITINIAEDVSDHDAVSFVADVIAMGRISNDGKQYCFGVVRNLDDPRGQLSCGSHITRGGADAFHVWRRTEESSDD